MKIVILYGITIEKCDHLIFEHLSKVEDLEVSMLSVNDVSMFQSCDVILNRIYASQANLDLSVIEKSLKFLDEQEKNGILCINSKDSTVCDYSKYEAFVKNKEAGVATPETLLIPKQNPDPEPIRDFIYDHQECVIKRNTSGRCISIMRVINVDEVLEFVRNDEGYDEKYVLQKFERNTKGHDVRIAVMSGKFLLSYGRTMVKTNGSSDNWLASVANGSQIIEYTPDEDEIEVAIKATQSIGAWINEVDMIYTKEGPLVIENNPTPSYGEYSIENGHVELFCEGLIQILRDINE